MSLRGSKRATGMRGDEAGTSKRRRTEPEDALWQLRPVSDLKMSSIYNRSASEAPAELFRKDLISAMKLPDNEPLTTSEYWIITDTWKQDWERGVQVPVNPDSLPAPKVKIIDNPKPPGFQEFKLPKDKYIHLARDAQYLSDKHHLSTTPARAEAACSYDLDATDTSWLKLLNAERARAGASPVTEDQLEKVIEELEVRTWDKIQAIIKSEEGLGIEFDENVICDVCRSPDSEDGNEMVFCDSCNICVHQACYGITVIPDGQWLCRPCGDGARPTCVLCPNLGGAMKCTPSGHKWAHVSCVLWIPEVSIGCAEKMEPITKISSIPASRWSLVCVLCRERKGACIQCSVKTCKTAYHVTCAFKHGLEMRAIIEDENADDGVKLRSYCQKHSVNSKKEKYPGSGSEEEEVKRKRRKDMTSEEKTQARAARLQEIEREFDKHVSVKDVSSHLLDVDQDAINYIYNYWKLKRRASRNRPLLPPKSDDNELLTHRQEQADLDKMKMFVQLRQDLERVRNLCYMVSRREKLSRSFFRMREQTFHKQVAVLSSDVPIPDTDLAAIIEANHGPSIYDRLYSHPNAPDHKNDFEDLLARIAPPDSSDEKKKDKNGLVKGSKSANPYKKHYVNGSRRSGSMYSGLSSEESAPEISRPSRYRNRAVRSSTDDDKKPSTSPKKKVSPKNKGKKSPKKTERKKKKVPQSKAIVESSSEDEVIQSKIKKERSCSKTLQQMEMEMTAGKTGQSATDSDDDLMPIRTTRNNKFPIDIYSSSSSEDTPETKVDVKSNKTKVDKPKTEKGKPNKSPNGNDSQQSLPRTKGAMKEFIPSQLEKKGSIKEVEKPIPKKRGRKPSNKEKKPPLKTVESEDETMPKENLKLTKQKELSTDLIVPQRQAAKKASENMRSTTAVKKEESSSDKQVSGDDAKSKPKLKGKGKEIKDVPDKVSRSKSKEFEKEPISYVPQRQAAKKAAAHIKSGLGSKVPVAETADADKKKETDKPETSKLSPKKEEPHTSKSPQESSSSSSNSSSSSYSSSSSSEEEQEKPGLKPTAKAREIKPAIRQPSMFSPPGTRPTVDLPFLDKVSKPLSSTSASSDSDSSKESERSDSGSPSPKRPRRRRKAKSTSTDTSPRKAPDKKLKTSEWRSECRELSPAAEGEESSRTGDSRSATRARTRSTTSSGNLPNKPDARPRKSSKDDIASTSGSNKQTPKETSQSSKFPTPERKANEEINTEMMEEPMETPKSEIKPRSAKGKTRSVSIEDHKDKIKGSDVDSLTQSKASPKKELKNKSLLNRRPSVKETSVQEQAPLLEEKREPNVKERRLSKAEPQIVADRSSMSPIKKVIGIEKITKDIVEKKSPRISDDFSHNDKHWLPKAPSPNVHPPPVEKPGDDEKYMTEDKSLDSDCADKSSVKMIAKIQATLNENTMIKSPKTPMDARTMEPIDVDNPVASNKKKQLTTEPDKKFNTQDTHVQGVEISKSAKIPSATNPFPNRSMFSPQTKENELFELEMMAVDDGFNHEDIMKPFTYPEFFFKEEVSKEQGVQETLNLVDRLRMQLSTKKPPVENPSQDEPIKDPRDEENNIPSVKNAQDMGFPPANENVAHDSLIKKTPDNDINTITINQTPHSVVSADLPPRETIIDSKHYQHKPLAIAGKEKWTPPGQTETDIIQIDDQKYDRCSYTDEVKEPVTVQSDVQSVSETGGDTISLSKQSDDSQSISVVDHSMSNDHEITQDNNTYENNNSMIHSDCATISSPYVSQDSKWRESKIATRRSSASSTNSEGSISSQKMDIKSHMTCGSLQGVMPEIDPYPPMPVYSCPIEPSMPLNQYSTYPGASPYLTAMGSIPLFAAGSCIPSQLALPSPGASLYGPGMPYSALMPPKQQFQLCAAFTSSSQNMALTTAMIAPPTPKPIDSPRDEIDVTGSDKFSIHVSSPSVSVDSYEATNRTSTKMSNDSNETITSLNTQGSKSPSKSSKCSSKFSGKSPGKSPGISPKQGDAPKGTKRPSNRSSRSQRGRGRSKSRGQSVHGFPPVDYMGNSIQSKLVGTVYDFDEEIANDGVDLKALRERRKSVEKDDRKSEHSYKDASQSPRAPSPPLQNNKKPPQTECKEGNPSTPEPRERSTSPSNKSGSERGPGFTQVQPVLPGPVDMRTYHPFENPVPPVRDAYHLLAFASGTADQHLPEIDEEIEKQLHSALKASHHRPGSPTASSAAGANVQPKETLIPQLPKVSLSDSRNQLKVKIKGPFLDANYSASSVTPVAPPPPAPVHETHTSMMNTSSITASSMITGSTNLRRMRKKELLRQYWTQDMNMDDPTANTMIGTVPPPAAPSTLTRAVITIPKAVASMTSIPTREDYKISETPVEKKKSKTTSGLRELRHLAVSMNDDIDPSDDVKLSSIAGGSNPAYKRRGRVNTKSNKTTANAPVAPKLKIKIGSNTVQQVNEEHSGFQFRPPKKRPVLNKPSFEDLRRESMKYRKMVMADFEEDEKTKKTKPSKSEKRKKKKDKKADKLRVINSESESATKLIIKIKRTKDERGACSGVGGASTSASRSAATDAVGRGVVGRGAVGRGAASAAAAAAAPEPAVDPFEYDPSAPDPLAFDTPSYSEATSAMRKIRTAKVTPIRLKLARSSQGSSYVMKESEEKSVSGEQSASASRARARAGAGARSGSGESPSSPAKAAVPLALNKHCEVR